VDAGHDADQTGCLELADPRKRSTAFGHGNPQFPDLQTKGMHRPKLLCRNGRGKNGCDCGA